MIKYLLAQAIERLSQGLKHEFESAMVIESSVFESSYLKNFSGTEVRIRISHGNRVIGVRVIDVLLYFQ